MVFPCKILINEYAKIFYVCLLIEEDKLISVNIKYLENDITIKGCLQNEDLRPNTIFRSLSNQRQSNRVNTFLQTPNDAKSMGSSFCRSSRSYQILYSIEAQ